MSDGQDVQNGVRAPAHRHVEDHRVVEGRLRGDLARQEPVARPGLPKSLAIATIRFAAS